MNTIDDIILKKMKELRERKFFGKIVLELKEGKVVLIRQEETIKPSVN